MFSKKIQKMSEDFKFLSEDIMSMVIASKNGKKASRKSLEPTVQLRKNIEELKEAENTDERVQFIKDKIKQILKGE